MTTCRSNPRAAVALQRALGRLEDEAATTAWAWDPRLSLRVDALLVRIEAGRG